MGPRFALLVPRVLDPTYLLCVGCAKKGAHLLASTGECGWMNGQAACMERAIIGGRMMIGGGFAP